MRYLLVQHRRLADIVRLLPACRHLAQQGHEVMLECETSYHDIFACVDYVRPVAIGTPHGSYDRVLELAVHPACGGSVERNEAFLASGLSWTEFVYDVDDIRGSYGAPIFTKIDHCRPSDYGLPVGGDYVLLAPAGGSQYVKYDPAKLAAWCHQKWPRKSIHVLLDRPDAKFPPFLRARRLRDLPALISWPRHFASINSAAAAIATGVRSQYVHFPQTGAASQDDGALAGISELVRPYPGEPTPIAEDVRVFKARAGAVSGLRRQVQAERRAALRVAFFTTLECNVGDEFIREGVRAILEAANVSYDPYFICKHTPETISSTRSGEVADIGDKYWNADVVIQTGAPVYWYLDGGKATSLTSEWHEWFWRKRVLESSDRRHPLFLNLGAGSCFGWGDKGERFMADPGCAEFTRAAGRRAALTTVRESTASDLLRQLGVQHHALPCPAFLAGVRHPHDYRADGPVGVNLMPLGGHFATDGEFVAARWLEECVNLLERLRSLGGVFLIAHNEEEEKFLRLLARPGEVVFRAQSWRAYLDAFAQCSLVVANRVHAAVCSAGLAVPAIILGNDTRAEIGRFIGMPVFRSGHASATTVFEEASQLWSKREAEHRRLRALRDDTLGRYVALVTSLNLTDLAPKHRSTARTMEATEVRESAGTRPSCILFSKTDALGDQIVASGLVRALLDEHPGSRIVWLVRDGIEVVGTLFEGAHVWRSNERNAPSAEAAILHARPACDAQWGRVTIVPVPIHPYEGRDPKPGATALWWAEFVRALQPQIAIAGSATVNWLDQLLVAASAASVRYGFGPSERSQRLDASFLSLAPRAPFTIEVPYRTEHDEMGHFEALASAICARRVSLRISLAPCSASLPDDVVAQLRESLVIAPGAGAPGRALPPSTAAEAVATFLAGTGKEGYRRCLVIEGPGDRPHVEQLVLQLKGRGIPVSIFSLPAETLAVAVALLRHARLFLCNETSYVHLASFLETPTVAIWGLGHWPRFVCRSGSITIVRTELACQGCNWVCCFEQWNCVKLLPAAAVSRALAHRAGVGASRAVDVHVVSPVVSESAVQAALAKKNAGVAATPVRCAASRRREIMMQAEEAFRRGDMSTCRSLLSQAATDAPEDIEMSAALGKVLYRMGEYLEAQKRLEHVVAQQPDSAPALAQLAAVLLKLKNYQAAEELLTKALALTPDNTETLHLAATCADAGGKSSLAVALYTRLLALEPGHAGARSRIADLRAKRVRTAAAEPCAVGR